MRYILHVAVTLIKQAANDNEIHFACSCDVKQLSKQLTTMRYILHVAVTLIKQAANDNEIHFARGGDVKQASS